MKNQAIINAGVKNDIESFVNYFNIKIPVVGRFNKLVLRSYQIDFLDNLSYYNKNLVISSRQTGVTTMVILHIIREILLGDSNTFGIYVPKIAMGLRSIEIFKQIYSTIADIHKVKITKSCGSNITFANGKSIKLYSPLTINPKDHKLDILWFDNFSSISYINQELIKRDILPKYNDKKIIFTTTGFDGLDPLYIHLKENDDYERYDIKWSAVPGRGDDWKREMIQIIGQPAFTKEYEI